MTKAKAKIISLFKGKNWTDRSKIFSKNQKSW